MIIIAMSGHIVRFSYSTASADDKTLTGRIILTTMPESIKANNNKKKYFVRQFYAIAYAVIDYKSWRSW